MRINHLYLSLSLAFIGLLSFIYLIYFVGTIEDKPNTKEITCKEAKNTKLYEKYESHHGLNKYILVKIKD